MSPNEATLVKLYASINAKDLDGIDACYHDDATCKDATSNLRGHPNSEASPNSLTHFRDIAFDLNGKSHICDMWNMICSKNKRGTKSDIHVEVTRLSVEEDTGTAEVIFTYHMREDNCKKPPIGRRVRNLTRSTFAFQAGKIVRQIDTCNAALWGAQAFGGFPGVFVGYIGIVRRWMAMRKLRKFVSENH